MRADYALARPELPSHRARSTTLDASAESGAVRVRLDDDRVAVEAVVNRFLDALRHRDAEGATATFAPVIASDTFANVSTVRGALDTRLLHWISLAPAASPLRTYTFEACRTAVVCRNAVMQPGDWYVEWAARGPSPNRFVRNVMPPTSAIVRGVEGTFQIVALSHAALFDLPP